MLKRICTSAAMLFIFFVLLHHLRQITKWIKACCLPLRLVGQAIETTHLIDMTLMFIVVTIETKVLPIAAIWRIIIVVMVLMMHRQLLQILMGELTPTTTTYPGVNPQGLFPISLQTILCRLPCLCSNFIEFIRINFLTRWS